MTPTTIIFALAALAFGLFWFVTLRANSRLHVKIAKRDEIITDLQRNNFQSGVAQQRLEARLAAANKELDALRATAKVISAPTPIAVSSSKVKPVSASTDAKAVPNIKAPAKPAAKTAPKAPAKKAAKK